MRGIIFSFIIITFTLNSFGQVIQPKLRVYHNLKNTGADYLYYNRDTGKALQFYDSAFNYFVINFDSSFCELIPELYRLHASQGNSKKVYEYLRKSIQINHSNEKPEYFIPFNKDDNYKVFRNSRYWQLFINEYDSLYKSATSMLNWELMSEYKSISQIDQIARQGQLAKTEQLCLDSSYDYDKIGWALMYDIDKINLLKVINLIKENGFLKYSETGGKIGVYNFVLFHSFSSCQRDTSLRWTYDFLDSLLFSNVLIGNYPPQLYAAFKDRSYAYSCNKPQKYGNWSGGSKKIINGLQDIENVDKLRYEIGLPSLCIQSLMDGFKLPEGYKIPNKYK